MVNAQKQKMLLLRYRVLSGHGHDVRQKRRHDSVVLLQQMQEELFGIQTGRTQAQVDNVLRQGRERQSLNCKPTTQQLFSY